MYELKKKEYNHETLDRTWSENSYEKYKDAYKTWLWRQLPNFDLDLNTNYGLPPKKIEGSILEIGSAAGGAYDFLTRSNLMSKEIEYTGLDISEKGINYCKENFKNANWIKQDLTIKKIDKKYDYIFERIAVHHMKDPLKIFENMRDMTNKSLSTSFVSCMNGDTISNLNLARYRHDKGEYVYFNIINIFEVLEILLSKFNFIQVWYGGPHEKLFNDSTAHQYVSPEINPHNRRIGRTTLTATIIENFDEKKIYILNKNSSVKSIVKRILFHFNEKYRDDLSFLENKIPKFLDRSKDQVTYNSPYAYK